MSLSPASGGREMRPQSFVAPPRAVSASGGAGFGATGGRVSPN